MPISGAFETLAQFAIAQAGFASVVIALQYREERPHPADAYRVFNAIVTSVAAGFLALLPIGFELVNMPEAQIWLVVSLIFTAFATAFSTYALLWMARLPAEARAIMSNFIGFVNFIVIWGITLACLINSMTDWLGPPHGGFYFFGIVVTLGTGAMAFLRLVFVRPTA